MASSGAAGLKSGLAATTSTLTTLLLLDDRIHFFRLQHEVVFIILIIFLLLLLSLCLLQTVSGIIVTIEAASFASAVGVALVATLGCRLRVLQLLQLLVQELGHVEEQVFDIVARFCGRLRPILDVIVTLELQCRLSGDFSF